jgi:tetratricopeptide (TPR) repeat protein
MMRNLILIVAVLASATCLHAQANSRLDGAPQTTATVQGEVTLSNGNPVPLVYLQLQPEGVGGTVQSATTDSSGSFTFSGAIAGQNYNITGNVEGFRPIDQLVMLSGQMTYVNITLVPLAGTNETANVAKLKARAAIPPKAQEQFNKGLASMDLGKTSDAEKEFKNALKIDPKFAPALLRLSMIYAEQNHFPEAKQAIHRAMAIDKDSPDNYACYGYLYMQEKQPEKAQQSFEKSIRMAPKDWFAQLEMGRLLYDRKDYRDALPHLEIARGLQPGLASTHLLLYDDLIRLARLKVALAELDDFVRRFPKSKEAANMRKVRPALAAAAARQR